MSGRNALVFLSIFAFLVAAVASCSQSQRAVQDPRVSQPAELDPSDAPRLDSVVRLIDTKTGSEIDLDDLLTTLSDFDAVFVGETHTDETTHRLELAIYEGLVQRKGGKVVLSLEMFARDAQSNLDRYIAGQIDEKTFLKETKVWSNYRTGYRDLIERARQQSLPVVGANVPHRVSRKIAMGGKEAYDALTAEERTLVAPALFPNSPAYWDRYARVVRGHAAMLMGEDNQERRLYSTQSLWDNTMAHSCAQALAKHPAHLVLHVNGGFHTSHRQGVVEQLLLRKPDARVATVQIVASDDLAKDPADAEAKVADYYAYVEARASGVARGLHAVRSSRELRYRLHVPPSARDDEPVPLLVWLGEEGARTKDSFEHWKMALGEDAAVAVVEMPYPQQEEELHVSGRWFWLDHFIADVSRLQAGLERISGYVQRHYPVDPRRIVLAGRGAGGTVVIAAALYTATLKIPMLAFAPARFEKLHHQPLPDDKPATRSAIVFPSASAASWWDKESAEYRKAGLEIAVNKSEQVDMETEIRRALELSKRSAARAGNKKTLLVLARDSIIARQWAELYRTALARHGKASEILQSRELPQRLDDRPKGAEVKLLMMPGEMVGGAELGAARFKAADFADAKALPLAPGPFGGTTVVVLPENLAAEERKAWKAIEEGKAIKKRSRFASLRTAFAESEPKLATVLAEIRDSGRSNVLVVPAVFCASAERMRSLRSSAGNLEQLTVTWLPGLGASLHRTVGGS